MEILLYMQNHKKYLQNFKYDKNYCQKEKNLMRE